MGYLSQIAIYCAHLIEMHSNFLYWAFAIILSTYYGVRGISIHRVEADHKNVEFQKKGLREWTAFEIVFIRYIQDFIFNLVCGMAGFVALYLAWDIFWRVTNLANIAYCKIISKEHTCY